MILSEDSKSWHKYQSQTSLEDSKRWHEYEPRTPLENSKRWQEYEPKTPSENSRTQHDPALQTTKEISEVPHIYEPLSPEESSNVTQTHFVDMNLIRQDPVLAEFGAIADHDPTLPDEMPESKECDRGTDVETISTGMLHSDIVPFRYCCSFCKVENFIDFPGNHILISHIITNILFYICFFFFTVYSLYFCNVSLNLTKFSSQSVK